jgi:alcohol dehydrogenase class IV
VDEVGLVIVAAVQGDPGPIHAGFAMDAFEHALEAAHSTESLGGSPI